MWLHRVRAQVASCKRMEKQSLPERAPPAITAWPWPMGSQSTFRLHSIRIDRPFARRITMTGCARTCYREAKASAATEGSGQLVTVNRPTACAACTRPPAVILPMAEMAGQVEMWIAVLFMCETAPGSEPSSCWLGHHIQHATPLRLWARTPAAVSACFSPLDLIDPFLLPDRLDAEIWIPPGSWTA
jgi:hypothetical protein